MLRKNRREILISLAIIRKSMPEKCIPIYPKCLLKKHEQIRELTFEKVKNIVTRVKGEP